MEYEFNTHTVQLFLDVRPSSAFTAGYGVFQPSTKTLSTIPEHDFYIQIPLYHHHHIHEYVDIQKDTSIEILERQEVNPFFLEYQFFDDINRNKVNNGQDLTSTQLNFIRSVRTNTSFMSDQEVRDWFDSVGRNQLPWNVNSQTISIYDIELASANLKNIISKADILNIPIYR